MESFEKMYSIKEAGAVLDVSRDSVVRLIRRGKLKAVHFPRMGGRGVNRGRRVRQSELQRFLKECEEAGEDPASLNFYGGILMALKMNGRAMVQRFEDSFQSIAGTMLEFQIPADVIRTCFETSFNRAKDQYAKDHEDEIAETVFEALLRKKI